MSMDTPRITFDKMSGYPITQSSRHIRLTIRGGDVRAGEARRRQNVNPGCTSKSLGDFQISFLGPTPGQF